MSTLILIVEIINYLILSVFFLTSMYLFVLAVSGHFLTTKRYPKANVYKSFAVLIPAYKEDNVILKVAEDALKQDYPKEQVDIVVIADQLKQSSIEQLKKLDIVLLEFNAEESSKAKALQFAFRELSSKHYDIALILDADNLMQQGFLHEINNAFHAGNTVIQAHRTAKNLNNSMALLDSISEEVNNHLFRKAHRSLGLSSILIGSAMAFDYKLLEEVIQTANTSFEDKEIEFKLLEDGHEIEYLNKLFVYDEKVQKSSVFQKQRTRWIYSQWFFFKRYFFKGPSLLLLRKNTDLGIKALETALIPRLLLIGFSFLFLLINSVTQINVSTWLWGLELILALSAIALSIPSKLYTKKLFIAFLKLPMVFVRMLLASFHARKAAKQFMHTDHSGAE
jgi:cellulose synthase/poly-beta-1,6-N-acetylglucosamine synthase-like glycosyltransferase